MDIGGAAQSAVVGRRASGLGGLGWLGRRGASFRSRLMLTYGAVGLLNVVGWAWALATFGGDPGRLSVALISYGLGLRHAMDADHIAAIDNVTRKLMSHGDRPVGVGFFFAVGHASVVVLVTLLAATLARSVHVFDAWRGPGSVFSTAVSAAFLIAIGLANLAIFNRLLGRYRRRRSGVEARSPAADETLTGRGLLSRVLAPMFLLISRSWHMLGLGFLFGLGFDTATEVAVFAVSATEVAQGVSSPLSALVFPMLFAAGMVLVDTTDGVLMIRAYDWALSRPDRRALYNLIITAASASIALLIGGSEAVDLLGRAIRMRGGIWTVAQFAIQNTNALGWSAVVLLMASWVVSMCVGRPSKIS